MKQQNTRHISKPVKSLSARAFFQSARKSSPNQHSKRIATMQTEPLERETFAATKKHAELQSRTSRLVPFNWKKQAAYMRPKQELADENHKLKLKINELQDDFLKEKSRFKQHAKDLSKLHRHFDVQFEKQKYYESGARQSNIVEGVKYQYQKTKQKYEEKCNEHEMLLKRLESSSAEEYRVYCQALEMENAKLKGDLTFLIRTEEKMVGQLKDKRFVDTGRQDEGKERDMVADVLGVSSTLVVLQKRIDHGELRQSRLKQKLKSMMATLSVKNRKIEHLQKLLTLKGNQLHAAIHRQRKTQTQLKGRLQELAEMKTRVELQQEKHRHMVEVLREKENIRFETEKAIFMTSLKQKDAQIEKLTSEVNYYATIFSYLKHGEDPFQQQPVNSLSKKNSFRDHSKQFLLNIERSLISLEGNLPSMSARKRVKTLFESGLKDLGSTYRGQNGPQNSTEAMKDIRIVSDEEYEGNSQSVSQQQSEHSKQSGRKIKKSNTKHNPSAVKMRHVKPAQISHLKKQLTYRFIFYRLCIDEAKQYLSFDPSKELEGSLSLRERRWMGTHITMREIKQKLMLQPFELREEEAMLLGRYVIEDSSKEEVYYQEQNEVERTIAKSIIRAFVGEYALPDEAQCRRELAEVFQKSGKNLRSALNSLAPTGSISAVKLIEISEEIHIDFSEPLKNWFLGQLLAKSPKDLSRLEYRYLFEGL